MTDREAGTAGESLEGFFAALRAGDHDLVTRRLGADPGLVRAFDPNPWCCRATPLNVAVERGDRVLVDLLLDVGADPDRKSDWWAGGFGPLDCVPAEHRDWLPDHLIARGATLGVHAAAALGRIQHLTGLLDARPDLVNAPGGDGARPLHFAATPGIVDLLLDRGALLDPRCVDHGSTPAQWSVRPRPDTTARLLERGAEPDVFMLAALGDTDRLAAALDAEPDRVHARYTEEDFPAPGSRADHIYVYTLAGYGTTAVHFAAAAERKEALELLVERGADPDAGGGYDDASALHTAAWDGRTRALAWLVELGATLDLDSGELHRNSPLGWAIVNGQVAAVETLLGLGAEVRPRFRQSVADGLAGRFRDYSRGTPADFTRIGELLAERNGGTG